MFITSNYKEIEKGRYKYSFFLNNKDDYESRIDFVKELNILIERFSENLANRGLVVKAYNSSIKNVRKEILDKPWPRFRLETIKKTPGILMIDTDFAKFNPNKNNWIYFYFIKDQRYKKNRGNIFTIEEADELFDRIAELIINEEENIFKKIKIMLINDKVKGFGKTVAKEFVNCGISISADKFLNLINRLIRNM